MRDGEGFERRIVGKLYSLRMATSRGLRMLPEGTLLLVVGTVTVGTAGAVDYVVMHSGITERIPNYWHGWNVVDEAG